MGDARVEASTEAGHPQPRQSRWRTSTSSPAACRHKFADATSYRSETAFYQVSRRRAHASVRNARGNAIVSCRDKPTQGRSSKFKAWKSAVNKLPVVLCCSRFTVMCCSSFMVMCCSSFMVMCRASRLLSPGYKHHKSVAGFLSNVILRICSSLVGSRSQ